MRKFILIACIFAGTAFSGRAQCSSAVLEAFGGSVSVTLYNTYITVGAIADGYVGEVYDAQRVEELMKEQVAMLANLSEMYDAAIDDNSGSLLADDKEFLRKAVQCIEYLKNEAQGLKDYAKSGNTDDSTYAFNREQAWKLIGELMGD